MILIDTSAWIAHMRRPDPIVLTALEERSIRMHPMVFGELSSGTLPNRRQTLFDLRLIPSLPMVGEDELLAWIEAEKMWGRGVGWVDLHLLAACRVSGAGLYTLDKRLAALAKTKLR